MLCKKEKDALIFYYRFDHFNRTGLDVFSHKFETSLSTFSDSFVAYLCSCHVLLAEFRTSATLTGFHVFALKFSKHVENFSLGLALVRTTFDDFFFICFGGLSFYTCAAVAICFLLNNLCIGFFTPW